MIVCSKKTRRTWIRVDFCLRIHKTLKDRDCVPQHQVRDKGKHRKEDANVRADLCGPPPFLPLTKQPFLLDTAEPTPSYLSAFFPNTPSPNTKHPHTLHFGAVAWPKKNISLSSVSAAPSAAPASAVD